MATKTQERVALVLKRIGEQCAADEQDAEIFAAELDVMLNGLNGEDFFGTEASTDPRGDFREGEWSAADRVEGIDATHPKD